MTEVPLGDVLRLEYGRPLPDESRSPSGRYPVYGANGEKWRTDKSLYDRPSIIVGRKGSAGELTPVEAGFWPLDVTYFVTHDEAKTSLRFLWYLLKTLDLPSLAKGVKPGINRNEVYSIPVKVPVRAEQERIVAILDQAFQSIDLLKSDVKASLISAGALEASYLDAKLSGGSAEWPETRLGDICDLVSGQHIDAADYNLVGRGFPYITGPSDFGRESPRITKWTERPKVSASRDDILITVKGSGVGKVNLSDLDTVVISRQVMAVRPHAATMAFIYNLLRSKFDYFQNLATGAAIPGLSRENVLSLRFPLPPQTMQTQLTKELLELQDQKRRLQEALETKLKALESLRQSLLNQAFSGNL